MRTLRLSVGKFSLDVELRDTPTADALFAASPFESRITTWAGEVYFTAPIRVEREADARDVIKRGELAFRVEGEAVVIGYGPTPNSLGDEIRLAMPSNIWGTTTADVQRLHRVEAGEVIRVRIVNPED